MFMNVFGWLFIGLFWLAWPTEASAADIKCLLEHYWPRTPNLDSRLERAGSSPVYKGTFGPTCGSAILTGPIEPARGSYEGDAKLVEAFVVAHFPLLRDLVLNSPGGDLDEAMRIGEIVRRNYINTIVPLHVNFPGMPVVTQVMLQALEFMRLDPTKHTACSSACVFIYVAGVQQRFGTNIGIHRPTPPDAALKNVDAATAQVLYRDLEARIRAYLLRMDADPSLANKMMQVPSLNLRILGPGEIGGGVPGYDQWLIAQCRVLTDDEEGTLSKLRTMPYPRASEVTKRIAELEAGQDSQTICRDEMNIVARSRISRK